MQLSTTEHEQLYAILQQYDENPQVQRMREFIQHGDVTTYQHCKNVVRVSFWLNRRLHLHADETSLAVGAFLHDFYLYDWHKRIRTFARNRKSTMTTKIPPSKSDFFTLPMELSIKRL